MDNVISRQKMEALISTSVQFNQNPDYARFIRSYCVREMRPGYVSIFDYIAIWKKLIDFSDDPLLPCKIGERVHISDLGVPGLIMMHSGTLASALRSAASYRQLISDCFLLSSTTDDSELKIALSAKCVDHDFDWHHVFLNLFSQFIKTVNFLTNDKHSSSIKLIRIGFSRDISGLESIYSGYFGCPTVGSQPEDYFVVPTSMLDLPVHNAQKGIFEELTRVADHSLELLSEKTYSERVIMILRGYTFPAMARIELVAQELNLSPATLKRKLQVEESSFSALKDSILFTEAKKIIRLGIYSPSYIAKSIGYSDGSSFSKAFRRWTGTNIEDYLSRAEEEGEREKGSSNVR